MAGFDVEVNPIIIKFVTRGPMCKGNVEPFDHDEAVPSIQPHGGRDRLAFCIETVILLSKKVSCTLAASSRL